MIRAKDGAGGRRFHARIQFSHHIVKDARGTCLNPSPPPPFQVAEWSKLSDAQKAKVTEDFKAKGSAEPGSSSGEEEAAAAPPAPKPVAPTVVSPPPSEKKKKKKGQDDDGESKKKKKKKKHQVLKGFAGAGIFEAIVIAQHANKCPL